MNLKNITNYSLVGMCKGKKKRLKSLAEKKSGLKIKKTENGKG